MLSKNSLRCGQLQTSGRWKRGIRMRPCSISSRTEVRKTTVGSAEKLSRIGHSNPIRYLIDHRLKAGVDPLLIGPLMHIVCIGVIERSDVLIDTFANDLVISFRNAGIQLVHRLRWILVPAALQTKMISLRIVHALERVELRRPFHSHPAIAAILRPSP